MTLYELGLWSILGSLLFLLLHTMKSLTQRLFSSSWQYYIALIPVAFFLGISAITAPVAQLMSVASNPPFINVQGTNMPIMRPIQDAILENESAVSIGQPIFNELPQLEFELLIPYLLAIWAVGSILFLLIKMRDSHRFRRQILVGCEAMPFDHKSIRLVKSRAVTTPLLIGIIKPVIILPDIKMSKREQEIILSHELIHFRRGDLIVKLIVLFANALHWFNPIAYWMTRELDLLCERSCDERLVKNLNKEERKFYGQTILSMLERSKFQQMQVLGLGLCDSKKRLERRLICIMKFKKMSLPVTILSVIVAVSIFGVGSVLANEYAPPEVDSTTSSDVVSDGVVSDGVVADAPKELTWIKPVEYTNIANEFGTSHDGIDLVADYGTDIVAAADGVVLQLVKITDKDNAYTVYVEGEDPAVPEGGKKENISGHAGSYGMLVAIGHGDGKYQTWYAHCSKLLVKPGDIVKQGDVIAKVGSTGRATGNHLHFEVRENGVKLDPMDFIEEKSTIHLPVQTQNITPRESKDIRLHTANFEDVVAANDGEVIFIDHMASSGYQVRIKQDDGYTAAYSNLASLKEIQALIKVGDVVKAGDKIGQTGHSGRVWSNEFVCTFTLTTGDDIKAINRVPLDTLTNYFGI